METLLTTKTASLTELRDPSKVLAASAGKPVAILNRNSVVAYLVPVEAVGMQHRRASSTEVLKKFDQRADVIAPILTYLQDK